MNSLKSRLGAAAIAVIVLASPGFAQLLSIGVDGNASAGWSRLNSGTSASSSSNEDLDNDISIHASGFVYHPKLLTYNISTSYTRNSTSTDERGFVTDGLGYSATFGILPERMFGGNLYFSHNTRDGAGALQTSLSNVTDTLGYRGGFTRFAEISYDIYKVDDASNWGGTMVGMQQRVARFGARRTWRLWNFDASDEYSSSKNTFTSSKLVINNLYFTGQRAIHKTGSLILNFRRIGYDQVDADQAGGSSSAANTAVTSLDTSLHLVHSPRLMYDLSGSVSSNAVNTVALLAAVQGTPLPPSATQVVSTRNLSAMGQGGLSFRATSRWTFSGTMGISRSNANASNVLTTDNTALSSIVNGQLTWTGGAAYQRTIRKLRYQMSSLLTEVRSSFSPAASSWNANWNFNNSISGETRNLRYQGSYSYMDTSSPTLFLAITNREHRLSANAETSNFRFARLYFNVDYSKGEQQWPDRLTHITRTLASLGAVRGPVAVMATHSVSDSDQAYFAATGLLEPGGSTGVTGITPGLIAPIALTHAKSDSLSVGWNPRQQRFSVAGKIWRFDYVTVQGKNTGQQNWQLDVNGSYIFGRFTFTGGFVKGDTAQLAAGSPRVSMDRLYFRLRFPFHVF